METAHLMPGEKLVIPAPRGPWIATRHGIAFELLVPTAEMVDWRDIAYGLGHLCRWTGHTSRFYSVAEHSCRVASLVRERMPDDKDAYLYALLHDAHEAYVGDFSAPLKLALKQVAQGDNVAKLITGPIDRAIYLAFGLCPTVPEDIEAAIHDADMLLLATELRDLMPGSPPWENPPPEPLPARIADPWGPARAVVGFAHDLICGQGWMPRGGTTVDSNAEAHASLALMYHEVEEPADIVQRAAHEELLSIVEPLLSIGETTQHLLRCNFGHVADVIAKLQKAIVEIRPGETVSDASARKQKEAE
jgi:hypothetical protein